MSHAGLSKSFWSMFRETSITFLFDIGGLFAGFMIAYQLGVFQLSPWAIALYPAILSAKGVISGFLSGRLTTALHLGTIYPRFFGNTKSFHRLIEAIIVLTLATSATISVIAIFFGTLFWGVTFADFPAILAVMVGTMSLGLLITLVTVKVVFLSFKRSLDSDTLVYPLVSTVADIVITFVYIAVLNLFFLGFIGHWAIVGLGLMTFLYAFFILFKNRSESDFKQIIKESLPTMLFVAFTVNVTGTLLKGVDNLAAGRREIYTVYPALIDTMGDAGLIVGSTATTKLALGILTPSLGSIKNHAKNIISAWLSSFWLFILLAFLTLIINGLFSFTLLTNLILIVIVTQAIAFSAVALLSYLVSLLTFRKGLDPDNFIFPVQSSLADGITTAALLLTLIILA